MTHIIEFGYISETYYAKGERNTLLLLTAGIKPQLRAVSLASEWAIHNTIAPQQNTVKIS